VIVHIADLVDIKFSQGCIDHKVKGMHRMYSKCKWNYAICEDIAELGDHAE